MSSLHPVRLTTEGATPTRGTRSARSQAPGKTSRTAASASTTAPVKARGTVSDTRPAEREGKTRARSAAGSAGRLADRAKVAGTVTAKVARTATATAARTAGATAKAAGAKAAAARTAAAARKAAPVTTEPTPEAPAARTAAQAPASEEPAAVAPAVRRPTPYQRTPVADAAAPVVTVEVPTAEDAVAPAEETDPRWWPRRRVAPAHRRPALLVAAALVGALGITAASASESTAVAETSAVSESVSVAEALGVAGEKAGPIVDAETTDRLGDLVASRAERDEQQVQAAKLQADADEKAREEAARAAAAAAEAARPKAVAPVKGARLTSGFGARWGTLHAGIDLAAPMRTPEYAAMDGVVLEAGPASGFGLAVYIEHENGDVTVYGHMDQILVKPGQVVKAGDKIALLGNKGQSTGPHLHFEVHKGGLNGSKIDPVPWLRDRGVKV